LHNLDTDALQNVVKTWAWNGSGRRTGDSPLIIRSSETDAKTLATEQEI